MCIYMCVCVYLCVRETERDLMLELLPCAFDGSCLHEVVNKICKYLPRNKTKPKYMELKCCNEVEVWNR